MNPTPQQLLLMTTNDQLTLCTCTNIACIIMYCRAICRCSIGGSWLERICCVNMNECNKKEVSAWSVFHLANLLMLVCKVIGSTGTEVLSK